MARPMPAVSQMPAAVDDHDERRGKAHDDVRAHARLLEAAAALGPDGGAAGAGHQQPDTEVQILCQRKLGIEIVSKSHDGLRKKLKKPRQHPGSF